MVSEDGQRKRRGTSSSQDAPYLLEPMIDGFMEDTNEEERSDESQRC